MRITRIDLHDFRNFKELHLDVNDGINFITGANASGKTNLIEGIYYLALTRSFKKAEDCDLIRLGTKQGEIRLHYTSELDGEHLIEASITPKGKLIVFDNEKQKSVNRIIGKVLAVVYSPNSVNLFRNEPSERRRFLDSSLALMSDKYLYSLTRFKKLLKERNNALNQAYDEDVIEVLTNELITSSYRLYTERNNLITKLNQKVSSIYQKLFLTQENITLKYVTSVPRLDSQEEFYKEFKMYFNSIKSEERQRKTTLIGVQRDDLIAYLDKKEVYAYASQGQNRLVVLALQLAYYQILEETFKQKPLLLLDDVFSDLDLTRQKALLDYLKDYGQVFITTTENVALNENIKRINIEEITKEG